MQKLAKLKYTRLTEEEVSGIYWHIDADTSIINSTIWLRRPVINVNHVENSGWYNSKGDK
jgi:hypothetical protein